MSHGQWTPNWRTWRNWDTGNARDWQTEATSSAGNWHVPAPPVRNWQTRMAPPPPPPPGYASYWNRQNAMATRDGWRTGDMDSIRNWRTGMSPPPPPPPPPGYASYWNRQNAMATRDGWRTGDVDSIRNWRTGMAPPPPPGYTGPAPYWNQQNAMATRDGWRTGDIDSVGNWLTELIPERNWHIRPNRNWQSRPNRRRRAWNWQTGSLPWTNRQTQQEDYIHIFPLGLALPPALDPWRPAEERLPLGPLLLTGLQEALEIPHQLLMQLPELEELPRLTEAEQRMALQQLKKKTYNPQPKRDGDNAGEDVHGKEKGKDQETKDSDNVGEDVHRKEKEKEQETETCTVCLEDFKPEEEMMLTPCNHMFHEDCIVPWVKSHGQCPICRWQFTRLPMNSTPP